MVSEVYDPVSDPGSRSDGAPGSGRPWSDRPWSDRTRARDGPARTQVRARPEATRS
jgi:hypothetical protein